MATTVSNAAVEVLARAECDGTQVRLPGEQLERNLYLAVNEVLERLGGKWKSGKVRAHVFDEDPAPLVAVVVDTGEMPPKNPMAFFPTPEPVVERMLARVAGMLPSVRTALEPSAGEGHIATALLRVLSADAALDLVELDAKRAARLRKLRFRCLTSGDFLTAPTCGPYDLVMMNPPFTAPGDPLAYIAHIRRAFSLLRPGGDLVAVAPSGFVTRTARRCSEFRAFVELNGEWEDLPPNAFKESGTGVRCVLVHLEGDPG